MSAVFGLDFAISLIIIFIANNEMVKRLVESGFKKPLLRQRCEMELENMGVPHVFLSGLTAITLSEIYCLVVSRLLAYGAIDKLPVRVSNCYARAERQASGRETPNPQ